MRNRDDRPWREHHPHVPREFDQGARRADYRRRGAHENDDSVYGHDPRWPTPGGAGPDAPAGSQAGGPRGSQGYPLDGPAPRRRRGPPHVVSHAAPDRLVRGGGSPRGTDTLAGTSGYDDYESETLYGTRFEDGDWPHTFRRGTRNSAARGSRPDHRGKGPQGYRRSDERLLGELHQRLTDDAYLDARKVSVSVADGVVRLDGTVTQRWMKHHAEHVVARCFGVLDVDNRLRIDPD